MEIVQIKLKEQLIIQRNNQSVVIRVGDNRGKQGIALLIEAPRQIVVDREEIALLKKKNKQTTDSNNASPSGEG